MAEDRRLELLELTAGLDTELLDEHTTRVCVDLERLGLPSRAIEREHQLCSHPLTQRLAPRDRAQLGDELRMVAELEVRRDPILERSRPNLLEPADLIVGERLVAQVGERRPAPERERVGEER